MAAPSSTPLKLDLSEFGGSGAKNSSEVDFSKYQNMPEQKASLQSQNIKEDHIYYHFDYTVLISIFTVCLTLLVITFLKRNKNKDSFK